MKLGARTFKTGLSVALSVVISKLLLGGDGVIAGLGAVASTQASVAKSYTNLKNRLLANAIGGLLAVAVVATIGTNIFLIALASMALIAILHSLRLGDVISLAVMTLIIIMSNGSDNLLLYAIIRVAETFVGVIVAFLINTFVHPPRYGDKLFHTIDYATTEFLVWIRASLRKNTQFSVLNKDLKWARRQLQKMESLYQLTLESGSPFKGHRFEEKKQLVIYRQMIRTARAAYKVLDVLHDNENVFYHFPMEMRVLIREHLETLMSGHEQIMLKFSGRVPANQVKFFETNQNERDVLISAFFDHAKKENLEDFDVGHSGNGIIHMMSAILAYEEELVHFNRLVSSYRVTSKAVNIANIDEIM